MNRHLNAVAAALAFATFAIPGDAASPDSFASSASEADFFSELPVVLSVTRLSQPLREAPGAVTVIDSETIRQSGARHLGDLLRLVPGFQVAETHRGAPYFIYHGGTSEEPRGLQVLVDGRTQYSPSWFGGVNFNTIQVALDDIDYIEVLRGSNSAAFGANAFLGVVNIVTKPAARTRGLVVQANAGNGGIQDRYARVGFGSEDANYRLSVERRNDAGLRRYYDTRTSDLADFRGDFQIGLKDSLELHLGGTRVDQGDGYSGRDNPPEQQPERTVEHSSAWGQLTWRRDLGERSGVQARYYGVRERRSENYDVDISSIIGAGFLSTGASGHIAIDIEVKRHDLEVQHTLALSDAMRVVWGAGLRRDRVASETVYSRSDWLKNDLHRLFGNFEWRLSQAWIANLGGSWDHESLSGTTFAPRVMLNHHLTANQTVRAGATRAYRAPSLWEKSSNSSFGFDPAAPLVGGIPLPIVKNQIASGNVKPEEIDSYELGYLGEFKQIRTTLDVRAFVEKVRGRIIPKDRNVSLTVPCEALPDGIGSGVLCDGEDFVNAQRYTSRGIEYQLKWSPRPETTILFNQTFIDLDAEATDPRADAADLRHVEESAPGRAETLAIFHRFDERWNASATYLHSKGYRWTRGAVVPPFHRLDWRLAYRFKWAGVSGEAAYTVRSDGGPHAEFRYQANPPELEWDSTEPIYPRHFFTLRLEY